MVDRIKIFIEYLGISLRSFEISISASNGTIRKAISNNTDIQSKWIASIVDNYPQLNAEWLLTGKGPMLKQDGQNGNSVILGNIKGNNHNIGNVGNVGNIGSIEGLYEVLHQKDERINEMAEREFSTNENRLALLKEKDAVIKELHDQIDKLHDQIDKLHDQIDKLHDQINKLHGQIDRLYDQLSKERDRADRLMGRLDSEA